METNPFYRVFFFFFPKMRIAGNFPGGLVAKTPRFQCRGPGFDPW